MFKIIISDNIYHSSISAEETKPEAERSLLFSLLKQQRTQILSAEETIQIKTNPETVLKNPSSLYLLDITKAEAMSIQQSYGVMCMSKENIDLSQLIDINDEHTTNEHETLGNGWDTVLNSVEHLPSNALIFTDRYLFADASPKKGEGFSNIRDILNELLPKRMLGEYHITIVFDNESKHPSYKFQGIATQLNKLKQQFNRDYPIMMEVLGITPDCSIYNSLHNRRIISNYYTIKVDHKLAAFNLNKGTVQQTITPQVLFTEDSIKRRSTPPLKSIEQVTTVLREFSRSLGKLRDHSVYCYAVNGKRMERCMGIRNRLMK